MFDNTFETEQEAKDFTWEQLKRGRYVHVLETNPETEKSTWHVEYSKVAYSFCKQLHLAMKW